MALPFPKPSSFFPRKRHFCFFSVVQTGAAHDFAYTYAYGRKELLLFFFFLFAHLFESRVWEAERGKDNEARKAFFLPLSHLGELIQLMRLHSNAWEEEGNENRNRNANNGDRGSSQYLFVIMNDRK